MRAALLAGATVLALVATVAPASAAGSEGRFDRPQQGFSPAGTVLGDSTPRAAGLDPAPIREALAAVRRGTVTGGVDPAGTPRPLFAGAVTLMATGGEVVAREATGWALRYADGEGTELPREQWEPVTEDTVFDMASVSKLFTSVVVMQQVEAGRVELDAPVASYLPEFAAGGKEEVTVRHLLTHTGGLPAWLPLWSAHPDPASRLRAALEATPVSAPGEQYLYSDLGLIALGALVERVSGEPLDALVRGGITAPLRMRDTGYNPDGEQRERAAATEYQATPPRGMVRGEVHDENAWALGGVSGHAGVFSTARDMSILAQAMLNGGTYRGARILERASVRQMIADENTEFPGDAHGLGFELDQRWYMGALSGPRTAGHTGYTGTSLVIDYASRSFAVLLSNRVHPSRSWGSVNPVRRAVADGLARALRVPPRHGPTAWATPTTDATTSTLQAALDVPAGGGRLAFDLFLDTADEDRLALETSRDGGTTWVPLPFDVRDRGTVTRTDGTIAAAGHRRWWQASTRLPAGDLLLRWRYTTDATEQGRGVLLDGIRAVARGRVLLDAERRPGALTAVGWRPARG